VPAHTPWLAQAADAFAKTLQDAAVRAPALDVLAGIDGHLIASREDVVRSLSRQLAQPVDWHGVMAQAIERGARVLLEIGPGSALARMARQAHPDCEARAVEEFQTLEGVVDWVVSALERQAMH